MNQRRTMEDVVVTTWNCNHPKTDDVGEWLPQITSLCGRGILLLQEPPGCAGRCKGGSVLVDEPSLQIVGHKLGWSCVCVPSELEPAITWVSSDDECFSSCIYASAVTFGWLGAASCYFPNPKDGSNERFMVAMHECRRVLDKMKAMGCQTFVVGCDLNVQLPSSIGDLTGSACCTLPDGADNRVNMTLSQLDDFWFGSDQHIH